MTTNVTLHLVICTLHIYQQYHSKLTATFLLPILAHI